MPAEGISLGALFLELGLDTESFFQDLEFVRSQALNTAKDIKFKIDFDASAAHQTLKGINDHLDLKEDHIRRINRTPIKPIVDFTNLDILDQRLERVSNNTVKILVDSTGLDNLESRLNTINGSSVGVSVNVDYSQVTAAKLELQALTQFGMNSTISVRYEEQQANNAAIKDLGDVIQDLTKAVEKVANKKSGGVVGGVFEGIGQQFGFTIGNQLILGLKRNFKFDLEKATANLFDNVSAKVKIVTENEQIQAQINKFGSLFENRLRKSSYIIGDGLISGLESGGNFETRYRAFLMSVSNPIKKEINGLTIDLVKATQELKSTVLSSGATQKITEPLSEALRQRREQAIRDRAIPLVQQRAAEELASTKKSGWRNSGRVVDENTNELIITTGGYAGAEGKSGERIAATLRKDEDLKNRGVKVISTANKETDISQEAKQSKPPEWLEKLGFTMGTEWLQEISMSLARPNLRGYSNDSIEMAAQALVALQKNPEIKIKFLGESGGGFVAEEAAKILQKMGYKNVEYLGVGTPEFVGGVNAPGKKIISPDEDLGLGAQVLSRYGLSNMSDNSQQLRGVKEHQYQYYKGTAEYQNFIYGAPKLPSQDELKQLRTQAEQDSSVDYKKKILEENQKAKSRNSTAKPISLEEKAKTALANMEQARRMLLVASDDQKEDLEVIVKSYHDIYLQLTEEPKKFTQIKNRIQAAKQELSSLAKNPGLESGMRAEQLTGELKQLLEDFKQDIYRYDGTLGMYVGTVEDQQNILIKELETAISELSNPSLHFKTETDFQIKTKALIEDLEKLNSTIDGVLNDSLPVAEINKAIPEITPKKKGKTSIQMNQLKDLENQALDLSSAAYTQLKPEESKTVIAEVKKAIQTIEKELNETDTQLTEELKDILSIYQGALRVLNPNVGEASIFESAQNQLANAITETNKQIELIDDLISKKVGDTAQKYQELADTLRGQTEFLKSGFETLKTKKLDEIVSGKTDYFQQPALDKETYEKYQQTQLASLEQTEKYRAFIPDPWYQKGASKAEDERMRQAQAEFKKGKRDAQIGQVKETIQTGLSWIDRMRGKRKGDAQKAEVDESGAIIVPEKQITLANKVGDAMVNSTISILKIAEPLAVRRINAMLMRSPGGGYEANPMRIDKLSDLTPEMIQHLSALGGWDSKQGLMLGARVLGAGAGMLARTNTGQAVGRFIGDKARWTLARVDDTMTMLNAADKAVEEVASTIPFGTSAWKLVKNVAAPIALGVGTTTAATHAPFLGPAIEAGTNLLQSGIAHGAGFLADATGSQIMSHAPEAVQAASGKMGQLAHLTGADQAFGTLTNWVGEQTSGILADIATGRLLYKKAPKVIAHLTGKGTTLALQAAANKSDVAKGLLQGFEGSEIDQAQDQTFKALQAAGVLTDRQARKAKRVIQNQNKKKETNQEPFTPQVVDLKQPEMVEVLPQTQNQTPTPKSEMVHSQKNDLATTSQAIKDAAKTAGEFAGKAYSAGMQAVESFKGVVRDLNSVYQYVEKAFNGFKEANDELINLVDEYKKGGADFRRIETQLQVIRDVREKAKEQFVKLRQELVETGQIKETVINKEGNQVGIGAVIAGRLGNIGTQVKQAENLVAQTRKMKPEEVAGHSIEVQSKPVGENINQGIAKGFKENNAAVNAVKEGVEEVIDVAKNTLGIQSPSKVFEYMGEMCGEGFSEGLEKSFSVEIAPTIQKQLKKLEKELDKLLKESEKFYKSDPDTYKDNHGIISGAHLEATTFPETYRGFRDKNKNLQGLMNLWEESDSLHISNLATSPWNMQPGDPRYTRGAGSELIRAAIQESINKGKKGELTLESLPKAIPFYEKVGFKPTGDLTSTLPMRLHEKEALEFLNKAKPIGSSIDQGLADGISDKNSAIKASKHMAEEVIKSAKDVLDIHSPSGEFEEIGQACGTGLAEGFINSEGLRLFKETVKHLHDVLGEPFDESKIPRLNVNKDYPAQSAKYIDNTNTIDLSTDLAAQLNKGVSSLTPELSGILAHEYRHGMQVGFGQTGMINLMERSHPPLVNQLLAPTDDVGHQYISQFADHSVAGFEPQMQAIGDMIRQARPELANMIEGILDQLRQGLHILEMDAYTTQLAFAQEVHDRTKASFKPESIKGSPIGENFSESIGQGIKQGENTAEKSAKDLALSVIETTEETFGIHSPSWKGIKVGEMWAEGIAIGTRILSKLGISTTIQKEIDLSKKIVEDNLKNQTKPSGSYGINNDYTLPGVYSMDLTGGNKRQKPISEVKELDKLSESGSKLFSTFSVAKNAIGRFINGLKGLENALNKPIFGIENLGTNIKLAIGGFLAFQVAMQAQQWLSQFTQEAFKAAMNLDRLKTAMTFASGSASKASQDLSFVRKTVDDLGIPLEAAQKGFVQMAAAAKSSGISNQDVRSTFTGVSEAATVLGLTADDTSGIFLALEQVMSKGKVQAEELRGQIGERLPGAFAIASRAMGVSEQELNKMMETGQVLSNDFIPKFAKQLQVEFGGSAEEASKNAQSAMFRFQNSVLKAQEAFGQVISPSVTAGFDHARVILDLITDNFQTLVNILIGVGVSALIKFGNQFNIVGVAGELLSKTFKDFRKGFGEGLAFIEAVINKDEKAIGQLKTSLQAAWTTIKNIAKTLATEFILPTMLIKTAEGLMEIFGRDELTTKMHDFTEQAVNGLERIRQKASEARGEVSRIGEKGSNKSGGIDLTLGLGDMMGFSFKTDDIIKGIRGFNDSTNNLLPESQRVKAIDKDAEGRYTGFVTSEEKKFNDSMDEAIAQREKAFELYDQVGAGKFKTSKQDLLKQAKEKGASPEEIKRIEGFADNIDIAGSVSQIGKLDEQIRVLKGKKEAAQGQPIVDKKQIKEIDDEMKKVMETRSKLSEPLLAARQSAENQLKSIDSQIEEAKQKFGANSPQVDALNQKFGVTKNVLETVIRQLDGFEKPLKQALDPVRALAIAFEKMNIALEETQRNAEKAFNKAVLSNSQKQLAGFSTNRFNSSEAAVGQAQADLGKAKDMLSGNESAINEMTKELDKPQNQQALAGVTTTSGKQISKDSTIKEIEEAKKRLKDGDPRKDLLDKLKDYKVAVDKLDELRNQVVQGELKVKEAIQQDALNKITEKAADREAINQRIEALNQLKNAQREASIVMQRANADQPKGQIAIKKANLGLSTEEAGVKEADIGIKQSQIGIQEAKNQITAAKEAEALARRRFNDNKSQMKDLDDAKKKGLISEEEYHKRNRDLTTQNVQAQSALGQATANVTKAQAGLKQAGVAAQEAIANKIAATITLQRAQLQASVDLQKSQLNIKKASGALSSEEAGVKEADLEMKMAQFQMNLARKGGSKLEIMRATVGVNNAQAGRISAQRALEQARLEVQNEKERAMLSMDKARGRINPEDVAVREADLGIRQAQQKLDFVKKGGSPMEIQRATNALIEAQAKKIETVNARLKEQLEYYLRIKEAQINLQVTKEKTEANKFLLNPGSGEISEAQARRSEMMIDSQASAQRMALKQDELGKIKQFIKQGVISQKEGAERILKVNQEMAQLEQDQLKRQIALKKELQDITYKLEDAQLKDKQDEISYQKELISLDEKRLDRFKQLANAQYEVFKSASEGYSKNLESQITMLDKAIDLAKQLQDESMSDDQKKQRDEEIKRTSKEAKKMVLGNITNQVGMGGELDPKNLFRAKQTMEDQLAEAKKQQLEAELQIGKQNLEIEIAKNKMAAQSNKFDAESLQIQAQMLQIQVQRQKMDLENARTEALKRGDKTSLAILDKQAQLIQLSDAQANRMMDLANRKLVDADQNITFIDQMGGLQRQAYNNQANARISEYNSNEFMRKQNQILSAGEAGINPEQVNKVGSYADLNRTLFGVGGGNTQPQQQFGLQVSQSTGTDQYGRIVGENPEESRNRDNIKLMVEHLEKIVKNTDVLKKKVFEDMGVKTSLSTQVNQAQKAQLEEIQRTGKVTPLGGGSAVDLKDTYYMSADQADKARQQAYNTFRNGTNNNQDSNLIQTGQSDQEHDHGEKPTNNIVPFERSGNTWKDLVNKVGQLSGATLKNIPNLVADDKQLKGVGAAGLFDPSSNSVIVTSAIKNAIQSGDLSKISKDDVDTIVHELRHAYQNGADINYMSTNSADRVAGVNGSLAILRKQGVDNSEIGKYRKTETDSQAFAEKYTDTIRTLFSGGRVPTSEYKSEGFNMGSGGFGDALSSSIERLASAIDRLAGNQSRPNLTVIGQEPKEAAGKIYNDINNIRADAARI